MQSIKIIAFFLLFSCGNIQAQSSSSSTSQERKTIKINNDIGDLTISFENGEITEFIINDQPVAKADYKNYQSIIDQFSEENVDCTASAEIDLEEEIHRKEKQLRNQMVDLLVSKDLLPSSKKYKIKLNKKFLFLNGKKTSKDIHDTCLDYFNDIYGHPLNSGSFVNFGKSKTKSSSSISIVE